MTKKKREKFPKEIYATSDFIWYDKADFSEECKYRDIFDISGGEIAIYKLERISKVKYSIVVE